jgi:hypothetical protein
MNDRIRHLGIEAGLIVEEWDGFNRRQLNPAEQKFAELIVQEMLVTCEEHPAWTGRMIGEQIKKNFGVEE